MNLATPRSSAVARPPALRRIFTSSTDTALPQHIESCSPPDSSSSSPFESFEKCLSGDSTEENNSSSSGEPPRRKSSKEEEHQQHHHQHHHIIRKWLAQRKERAAEKTEAMKNVMCSHYEQKYNTVAGLSQTQPKANGSIPSSV